MTTAPATQETLLYTAKTHTMGGRDGRSRSNDGAYFLRARLNVSLPGLARDIAQTLIDGAHATCPYSKATHGNIDVTINLV
jgi:organic hydroperoxide reductase OsmC/OhrA